VGQLFSRFQELPFQQKNFAYLLSGTDFPGPLRALLNESIILYLDFYICQYEEHGGQKLILSTDCDFIDIKFFLILAPLDYRYEIR